MINKEMTLLEIVEKFPPTQTLFQAYEAQTGHCLLCNHLFETLEEVCLKCGLSLEEINKELQKATGTEEEL